MKEREHYGLGTAISMIVGICIGSGIFFKADDILAATGGDVWLGVTVFVIGALCIIFGSITLSQLASRSTKTGGAVSYFEEFVSSKAGSAFGWFQMFVYFPTIAAVVSWVSGIYTLSLLGLPNTLEYQIGLGFLYSTFFFLLNYFSLKSGGRFQNVTTFIKMIPLIGIGLFGLFWTTAAPALPVDTVLVETSSVGWGWLAALAPLAFSFDGWIVSTTITPEVKNHRINMPIALTIGPLIVLAVYLFFFLGMVTVVGPEYILSTGDGAISQVGTSLFGENGQSIILSFVLIAVLGVVNGLSLGYIRLPHSLATKNMLPFSEKIAAIDPKRELSPYSAGIAYAAVVFWLTIHYFTQKVDLLAGGDISEIAIVFSYVTYILLYLKVMKLKKDGAITSRFLGIVAPILGITGSLVILLGGLFANPVYSPIFLVFSGFVCLAGYLYYRGKENRMKVGQA
ncbi:APC family permease [Lacticigenium naphthae]|uniref:APC family permease n=1 Tax=Lacticigenium naphthae TaxID=515351 RepID=UPI0003F6BEA6|nr:APC family permease [Lacticigenium naphthae]